MKSVLLTIALATAGSVTVPSESTPDALVGIVRPSEVVRVGAALDGRLAEVNVERGDTVTAGQKLARLDSDVEKATTRLARARAFARADIRTARARRDWSEERLAKRRQLFEDNLVSAEEIRELETEVELATLALTKAQESHRIAQLEFARAQAQLALRDVVSPIDGVVTERFLSAGELLSKSNAPDVVQLARLDPLEVELFVPLELYGSVQSGQAANVRLHGFDAPMQEARVTVVDPLIDTASGTFRVELELPNPDHRIPAGLHCTVLIAQ